MAANSSSILVIGGTGYIGKHIVLAAAHLGHPTFALVRSVAPADAAKAALLRSFSDAGVHLLEGDLNDHESLVKAAKMADVVISAVGGPQLAEQMKIIAAIKEAGNVKRFLPSEFGVPVDRMVALEPAKSVFAAKAEFRRHTEAEGVPYTFVVSNAFGGYSLPAFAFSGENVSIMGDGNNKTIVVDEDDVGTYAVKAAVDPRAENKIVYIRPPANIVTANEIYTMLEKKTNKSYNRSYIPNEVIRKQIQEAEDPMSAMMPSILHAVLVEKANDPTFEIDPSIALEATELFPDVNYTTVDQYLDRLLNIAPPIIGQH